ncbi:MAG TPA: hypothetical protein VEP90_04420 [Methylomirabilota bacterium]|nr:hypothetical protein [Methylomirabilota bacterium]
MTDSQIQEQKQERIRKHLEGVIDLMEQAINSKNDVEWKRIHVDAATSAVLATVAELLPVQIQEQIRTIISLHEKTWNIDLPSAEGETPHKPLSEELIDAITHEDENSEIES